MDNVLVFLTWTISISLHVPPQVYKILNLWMMSHMYMYKNTDTYEYLIYFLHEFISFKDMLSYKELNYDVYIYKSTETDYFITLFFINNYDEIWFICQLSISILKIQYEHVLLLDRFSKRSKVNSNIQNLIATTENSIIFVFI